MSDEDELEIEIPRDERAVLSFRGDLEPRQPRSLLEAHQGNPDQRQIFGNGGRPILVGPGRIETLARVRADDPLAQTAIIALAAPDPMPSNTNIFAVIEWGTDGVTHTAICDFLQGQQLSVSGSWVQVSGGSETGSQVGALLGASLAYGYSRGLAVVPTRTLRHASLVGPSTVTFNVPRYAVDLRYIRTPATSLVTVELLDSGNTVIGEQIAAAGVTPTDAIPIPADCVRVRIRVVAVNVSAGRLMFGLAL